MSCAFDNGILNKDVQGLRGVKVSASTKTKEKVLGVNNGSKKACSEERSKYFFRKRKQKTLFIELEADSPIKIKKHSQEDLSKVKKINNEDDENSVPRRKQNWRSKCGRKRKYFGQASIRQGATKRERNRFNIISNAFDELRKVIPKGQHPVDGKLSKYATLKLACTYISLLTNALGSSKKIEEVHDGLENYQQCEYGRQGQSDSGCSSGSGLSEDEVFTGDFTDILYAEDENEPTNIYDDLTKQNLAEATLPSQTLR